MAIEDIIKNAEDKMYKTEEHLTHELAGVRTGKASPALVENIMVDVYGTQMRIRDLAAITTPENRMIQVQPWDGSTVSAIEKGIQKSNLGLNPSIDKKTIRIVLPELTQERREELSKFVKKLAEDARVAVRHVRREAVDQIKKEGKGGGISEDDVKDGEKQIQKLTDKYVERIDQHLDHKEKEIMTV